LLGPFEVVEADIFFNRIPGLISGVQSDVTDVFFIQTLDKSFVDALSRRMEHREIKRVTLTFIAARRLVFHPLIFPLSVYKVSPWGHQFERLIL